MSGNNVYNKVEEYLDECIEEVMSSQMTKDNQEYYMQVNVYMLKRVVKIMLSEMQKDNEAKQPLLQKE